MSTLSTEKWPELRWEQWKETAETLHMFMQIVGKTRLSLTPIQNHWWNTPFYLTARGLTTSAMPVTESMLADIEFDFVSHQVICRTSVGGIASIDLRPTAVARFHTEFFDAMASLGVRTHINPMPVEVANPIRSDIDIIHNSYDRDAVSRFWHVLRLADTLFKRFSTNFYGKISPVHFFWGSFDLAVTRFNGRRSSHEWADRIQAEAYSHEVISAGFWPGNGGYGRAAFYCYAAPIPGNLNQVHLSGPGGYNGDLGEFILDYEDARSTDNPVDTVLRFLDETYIAAAEAANWDRRNLDRTDFIVQAVRSHRSQSG